jgi:hypothetical protein
MKALFTVAVVLLICIAGVGFYRGWFSFSTENTDQKPSATFTMDKDKIHADEEKVQKFGHETKEKLGHQVDKVKEPAERQP